jgi:hypothetical protein
MPGLKVDGFDTRLSGRLKSKRSDHFRKSSKLLMEYYLS